MFLIYKEQTNSHINYLMAFQSTASQIARLIHKESLEDQIHLKLSLRKRMQTKNHYAQLEAICFHKCPNRIYFN
ncbi:CLUMA_CG002749, isoform A [Clunio marinus]|uniref:CLUMA_CG002749, isoform A n=1 Tax=Clunio marinus TaxID=568069 RepID=A0A1J1HLE3_9DIPT|nr:CLUMA_CG002749, isoform A [Clunio marinus]